LEFEFLAYTWNEVECGSGSVEFGVKREGKYEES
jgi:hypothetical protein